MRTVKFDFTDVADPAERAHRINALGDTLHFGAMHTTPYIEMDNGTGWFSMHLTDRDYDRLKQQAVWFSHYAGFDSLLFHDDRFGPVNALSYPTRNPRVVRSEPHSETWVIGGANPMSHLLKGF